VIRSRIAILGGGISGLSCAYYLKKNYGDAIDLTIFEKEERLGGWIQTRNVDGFLFESGPRSIRLQDGEETLALIHDLGLDDQLLFASKAAKNRYLLWNGKLEKILSFPLMRGVLPGILNDLFASKGDLEDESVHAFFSRRFSSLIADRFIDPLIKGIYAGDSKQLSIKACFPQLMRDRSLILGGLFGSFKRKKRGIVTLKGGLGGLISKLGEILRKEIRLGVKINSLEGFDKIISTLPAHALADLLPESRLQKQLRSIPFATAGVVHLGFRKQVHEYQGFGYLVPSSEKEKILGVIFDSSVFPEQSPNTTRLTVMIGGDQENLEEIAKDALKRHLGISEEPDVCSSYTASRAIPQYPVGFLSLLGEIEEERRKYPHLFLLGTSFHGVSVNKAIASAKKLSFQKFAM
jgi:protoporphyrinogen/coproporphyrinogen III oxidase